jgi:hypothetical protein
MSRGCSSNPDCKILIILAANAGLGPEYPELAGNGGLLPLFFRFTLTVNLAGEEKDYGKKCKI